MAKPTELNVRIRIDADTKDASDYLKAVTKRMKNLRPVWPKVQQQLKVYMISNFTSQGLPVGGWKPLDAEYASLKMQKFPGAPMLVRQGGLFSQVLKGPAMQGGRSNAEFSFDGKVAAFHQYGTTKMAARPILFAPEEFIEDTGETIIEYIHEGII